MAGGDEAFEERVGLVWFALKFRVELAGDEEWMILQFDYFDQLAIRRETAEDETGLFETLAVGVVEFVTVPMALVNQESAVEVVRQRAHHQLAGLRAEPHCAAFFGDFLLLVEQGDHRVWRGRIK